MNSDIYKLTEIVCDKMIKICKSNNKSFLDIYKDLTKDYTKQQQKEILTNIPEILAKKGYEIINSDLFELRKY